MGALDMRRSCAWVLGLDKGGHLIWRLVEGGERIVKGEREGRKEEGMTRQC